MNRCSVITTGHLGNDHIAGLEALHGTVTVDRRCADLAELVAVARTVRAHAALVIGATELLTRTLVSELRKLGVTLVAVSEVAGERSRLSELGVTAVPDEVSAEALAAMLSRPSGEASLPPPPPPGEQVLAALESQGTDEKSAEASPGTGPSPEGGEPAAPSAGTGRGGVFQRSGGRSRAVEPSESSAEQGSAAGLQESGTEAPGRRSRRRSAEAPAPSGFMRGHRFLPRRASRRTSIRQREAARRTNSDPASGTSTARSFEDQETFAGEPELACSDVESVPPSGITVVWGTHGSPGRTTVAVNLAAELALTGVQVLLIDADTIAASAAVHLGLLEETAGLAQACRQADRGRVEASHLRRTVTAVDVAGGQVDLLTGLPRPDRWPELREAGLRQVLHSVRGLYDHVVVDTAASVERDEELSYDTQAPQRHAATLCALTEADRLLLVGAADAVGFSRTVRAFGELSFQVPEAPVPEVIINKVRTAAVGRSPKRQLREAWSRFGPEQAPVAFLPWDPQSCDYALLHGQTLAEAAPESELRRALIHTSGTALPERRRRFLPSLLRGRFGSVRAGE